MKDNEIIKDFKKITQYSGFTDDVRNTLLNTLHLINRQHAEIDRLERYNEILTINADTAFQDGLNEAQDLYAEQIKDEIKSEAIKEFAERLKAVITINNTNDGYLDYAVDYNCLMEDIDNLEKEIVGEE